MLRIIEISTFAFFFVAFVLYSQESPQKKKKIDPQAVLNKESIKQGQIRYKVAEGYFNDGYYSSTIKKLTELLYLYPKHPLEFKALQLLSKSFQKNDQLSESIQVDMEIYRKYSTTEEGLTAYLNAGRKSAKIGNIEQAKSIMKEVESQVYSDKLAKDAKIELDQIEILYGEFSIPKPPLN